jgi:4-amino-4-deoxy-L-arabinose transferase-like glycosyltransferase
MQRAKSITSTDSRAESKERVAEFVAVTAVLVASLLVYAFLFNRSNVLSHSIGYNLYASERVLEGAVPYRDFHTLYPPATFYLNAALFKLLGVSLHAALLGVLVFKVLTIGVIYLTGRQVMPRAWAVTAALSSLLWLRPNGPFKSVPMHYGALLLALAMYFLLKYEDSQKMVRVFLAGGLLGLVVLFKHNIGVYALIGSMILLLAEDRTLKYRFSSELTYYRRLMFLLIGCAAVIVPALVFMQLNNALAPMVRTLLFGPGEFLLSRLAAPLSPLAPLLLVAALAVSGRALHSLRSRPAIGAGVLMVLIAAISTFLLLGDEADVNQIIFYMPMFVLGCGLATSVFNRSLSITGRRALLIVFVFAAAALMELFPRFAREQSIAAMPFVMLFLFYLLFLLKPAVRELAGGTLRYRLSLAVLPLTFLLIQGRLFYDTYFDSALRLKAGAEVSIERGRGVYFPSATAEVIDNAVEYIQQRVPVAGNAFAQSDAGTSLLFLSNRRNVSNAQFWIGVGVTLEERAATLDRIDKSQTKLIITSDEVLAAEKYEPMRDYIERHFKPTARFDDVLMLER